MIKKIKAIDWVVGLYLGYFLFSRFVVVRAVYAFLWLVLFEAWAYVCEKEELCIWKIKRINRLQLIILCTNAVLFAANFWCSTKIDIRMPFENPVVVIAAAIAEEIIFRGYLFDWLERMSSRLAIRNPFIEDFFTIFISGVIFSGAHALNALNGYSKEVILYQLIVSFIAGIGLGITRKSFNGIKACIWIHILFNVVSFLRK